MSAPPVGDTHTIVTKFSGFRGGGPLRGYTRRRKSFRVWKGGLPSLVAQMNLRLGLCGVLITAKGGGKPTYPTLKLIRTAVDSQQRGQDPTNNVAYGPLRGLNQKGAAPPETQR